MLFRLIAGPPQGILHLVEISNHIELAGDRLDIVDDHRQGISLDLRRTEEFVLLRGHPNMDRVALSPDGALVDATIADLTARLEAAGREVVAGGI